MVSSAGALVARPVDLVEVDHVDPEALEALLALVDDRVGLDVLVDGHLAAARVVDGEVELALGAVPTQAALGQHLDRLAATVDRPADEALAVPAAVDRRGVDGVDAGVDRGLDGPTASSSSLPPQNSPPIAQAPNVTTGSSRSLVPTLRCSMLSMVSGRCGQPQGGRSESPSGRALNAVARARPRSLYCGARGGGRHVRAGPV